MAIIDAIINIIITATPADDFLDKIRQTSGTIMNAFMSQAIYHDWNMHWNIKRLN